MLILLPPSEGKAVGSRGAPLDLDRLSFPGLTGTRRRVLDALVAASGQADALAVLGAPKGAADRVAANTELWTAPTLRVADLYTGVLYDALDLGTLDPAAKRRATRRLVVVSALFGALHPNDRVPSYRLSMGVDLPGVGPLARAWREPLGEVLPGAAGRGVVVDLRSSTYAAAWKPTGALAERTAAVHVVRDSPGGRTAVSHMAKHSRGLVARELLASGADPHTPDELVEALGSAFAVSIDEARPGRPRRLEVVEPG
ncbi:peroxide stress protein YaaA [Acidimicrobiia bacterium EGI L10123]|uniref:YaaA family protein n=1 Tax=Salinilacustrithrix flava TaxID=2957203 RepID=UPI003D7C22BD|nr:peroxide stress protein YaaA [Acidimicrobiia bacterium EGI L10123]